MRLQGTRVLVTGGAGFIGSTLVDRLVTEGAVVSVIDDLSSGNREYVNPDAQFYEMKIEDPEVASVFAGERPALVFHMAAQKDVRISVDDPRADASTNVLGFLNVLEQTIRLKGTKFIFASSGGVIYGEADDLPTDESCPPAPLSPYGVAKLAGELYLRCYQEWNGLAYTSLRYANVYGPRQDPKGEAGVVAIFADNMLSGTNPTIYGDGSMTRDYIYVDDVIEATMRAIDEGTGECINVGTSRETSVIDLHEKIRSVIGFEGTPQYRPKRRGELQRSCLSLEKAQRLLGWSPQVGLDEGLSRTIEWFRSQR